MALVVKDRVQETTTTTGTGTITLAGAVSGFQSFSVIGNGNTTYYTISGGSEWEVGIGTYTSSGTTLSRDTVLESSNSGSLVPFSAGTKTVFCTYPAERSLYVDGTTITPATSATLPVASGGTGSATAAFSGANITDLNATAITAGTIANNRTTASSSNGASTIVQRDAAGDFSSNIITANSYSGSGANLTSLNASSISTGTLGVARGGTGAATLDANNVILGNGTSAVQFVAPGTSSNVLTSNGTTWVSQAASGGAPTTAQVLSALSGLSVGDVGTFALLGQTTINKTSAGGTEAGSNMRFAGVSCTQSFVNQYIGGTTTGASGNNAISGSGTWRCCGQSAPPTTNYYGMTLWIRIS